MLVLDQLQTVVLVNSLYLQVMLDLGGFIISEPSFISSIAASNSRCFFCSSNNERIPELSLVLFCMIVCEVSLDCISISRNTQSENLSVLGVNPIWIHVVPALLMSDNS